MIFQVVNPRGKHHRSVFWEIFDCWAEFPTSPSQGIFDGHSYVMEHCTCRKLRGECDQNNAQTEDAKFSFEYRPLYDWLFQVDWGVHCFATFQNFKIIREDLEVSREQVSLHKISKFRDTKTVNSWSAKSESKFAWKVQVFVVFSARLLLWFNLNGSSRRNVTNYLLILASYLRVVNCVATI